MKILNIRNVFDRKGKTRNNPKKLSLVHIEVVERQSKRKKYIYTGVKILASQHSNNGGFSIKNHPNALVLKTKVLEVYNKVEAFIHSDKCTCIDDIDNWDATDESQMTFLEFIEQEMNKKAIKSVTKKTHKVLLRNCQELIYSLFNFISYLCQKK